MNIKRTISFSGEIPFPEVNTIIYREIYTIEQWIRRIAYAALMTKYGPNWTGALPDDLYKNLKSRLHNLSDRVHLDCENSDNIIWFSTLDELNQLLTMKSIWPIVNELTGYKHDLIISKIDELREIRNVIGHNRAVNQRTLTIFHGISTSLQHGIETFKRKLYDIGEIHNDIQVDNIANTIFYEKTKDPPFDEYQFFLSETKYFYSITRLPAEPLNLFVRVSKILNEFHPLENVILSIFINKTGEEFTITWPKIAKNKDIEAIIDIFLGCAWSDSNWTKTIYMNQNPKFICNPKIWFYENQEEVQE